ncbi:transcriptional regulator GcvA [Dasania marina]|uniref:transcriptional regulator GcvA n=1 Tax=Dasania marina TaxID=471499 RepID=UPI0030D8B005
MKRYLPPLNSLRAFEVAARHLSFREAADELSVSHSAISHQVKLLETQLCTELFHRGVRSVELTEAGALYYPILRDALDRIADGTERVRRNVRSAVLTVQVYVTFANGWLIPRLSDFQEKHPDIQVNINTSHIDADFERSDADVCVLMGYKTQEDVHYEYLFTSDIFPVCSPRILEGGIKLKNPKDLLHHKLLSISHAEKDWPNWFAAAGVEQESPVVGGRFDSYSLALTGAIDGAGVALALSPFGLSDIRSGKLVKPFDVHAEAFGDWYLSYRSNRRASEKVKVFQKWLLDKIQEDGDIPSMQLENKIRA